MYERIGPDSTPDYFVDINKEYMPSCDIYEDGSVSSMTEVSDEEEEPRPEE